MSFKEFLKQELNEIKTVSKAKLDQLAKDDGVGGKGPLGKLTLNIKEIKSTADAKQVSDYVDSMIQKQKEKITSEILYYSNTKKVGAYLYYFSKKGESFAKKIQSTLKKEAKNIIKSSGSTNDITLLNKISKKLYNDFDDLTMKEVDTLVAKILKGTGLDKGDFLEITYEDGGWDIGDEEVLDVLPHIQQIAKNMKIK